MYIKSAQNTADILTKQPKAEALLENSHWSNRPEFLMEPKAEWPSQKPVYNLMPKETMRKELIFQSDELKLKAVTCQRKTEWPDPLKICVYDLKWVYNFETAEKQSGEKTSEIKSIMDQNCWTLLLYKKKCYACIYADTNSFREKLQKPKLIESMEISKLKPSTALNFAKAKQVLTRKI